MVKIFNKDRLLVKVYKTRREMGQAAADAVAKKMQELLKKKETINMVFAAAPSQNEFLEALASRDDLEWHRVNAFHLDEYIGLDPDAPQRFGNFLKDRIFGKVNFKSVNYLNGNAENLSEECERYGNLLEENPLDIACIGIGENGHIAFNDPPVADFNDPVKVKRVKLDEKCRTQQVNDGCFPTIEKVPEYALTMTVPAICEADFIYVIVPGPTKKEAVRDTIYGPISTMCPASILRKCDNACLYLDEDAASLLQID